MLFELVSAWNRRRRRKSGSQLNPWIYRPVECWQFADHFTPSRRRNRSAVFTLKEMMEATFSFGEENFLGNGGFGKVYRGILRYGEAVAIKKMELPSFKVADGEREFRVEVDILSRLDHPNLVSLVGYCADGKQRFLVYEYMRNGNLQDRLNGISAMKLDWNIRLKIALGAARGLAYLHCNDAIGIPIVHRDFKSSNILLTDNYDAKISDFGLAKLMPEGEDTYETAEALGTFGYFDPEYTSTGKLTLQSDVYAFGVVLLELLTGRQAVELCQGATRDQNLILQAQHLLNDRKRLRKVVDPEMPKSSYTMDSVSLFARLASRCVCKESSGRPKMSECVRELVLVLYANVRASNARLSFSI